MRSRNREVNIFNMSLLDILTGMLGAFLFLMLGLVPYYMKAQGGGNADRTPPVSCILNITARWNTPAGLDLLMADEENNWYGSDTKSLPLSRRKKIANNCCSSSTGWQTVSNFADPGHHYLITYSLQSPAPGDMQTLAKVDLSFEMVAAQIDPTGVGLKGYYSSASGSRFNASGAKPGAVYALCWVEVTKDTTKAEYYRQYDYTWVDTTKYPLPPGVQEPPKPLPVAATPVTFPGLPANPSGSPGSTNTPVHSFHGPAPSH